MNRAYIRFFQLDYLTLYTYHILIRLIVIKSLTLPQIHEESNIYNRCNYDEFLRVQGILNIYIMSGIKVTLKHATKQDKINNR